MHIALFLAVIVPFLRTARADVTVYYTGGQQPLQTGTPGIYTGLQAFNPVVLVPPPLPSPAPPSKFDIRLQHGNDTGLSIKQSGAFFGFSIEFAVASQILGKNSSVLHVPFLNLMSNLEKHAGRVNIRLGGSSQDTASLVGNLGSGQTEAVLYGSADEPLVFTEGFLSMLAGISSLVNTRWTLGIPFNESQHFRLGIAEFGEQILGNYLVGLQVGNQPDQYATSGYREYNYSPNGYVSDWRNIISAMDNGAGATAGDNTTTAATSLSRASKLLIGPNIISGYWTPEMVWNTGFAQEFNSNLAALAVEHYPSNNCFVRRGQGPNITAQESFPSFLNHTSCVKLVAPYLNSAKVAQDAGKPLLMMETNTASCGGFPGLSDSFGASLWAVDYALQMAYSNFSGAMFHVNGANSSYNAFTPSPPLQGSYRSWTIGPIYYAALVVAETLGSSNASQVLDLNANDGNIYTPGYAIYEMGLVTKVALINYMTDPTGGSDYVASISISAFGAAADSTGATPGFVFVKYLSASSVSQKGNFTWAGQTFGGFYESNGLLQGTKDVKTVSCPDGVCQITVPAPSFALVFLSSNALEASGDDDGGGGGGGAATKTFATTTTVGNAGVSTTLDPAVLATSNGRRRVKGHLGSTTKGKVVLEGGARRVFGGGGGGVVGVISTAVVVVVVVGVLGAIR